MTALPSAPSTQIFPLNVGDVLTVTNDADSTARAGLIGALPGDGDIPATWTAMAASATLTFGPYASVKRVRVDVLTGQGVTATVAPADANRLEIVGDVSALRIIAGVGVPTDAVTGANVAGKGSIYIDQTNGKLYVNGGSAVSTVWKIVTSAA